MLHPQLSGAGEFHEVEGVGEQFGGNICHRESFVKGDPDAAFARADELIDESFEFPMIYQYAMEPHSAVATFTVDGVRLWSSSAHPFLVRSELAHMFHLPHAKVEVVVPFVGGAYGSKSYFKLEPLAVAVARKTGGRPVRIVQSLTEAMLTTRRHSARVRIRNPFNATRNRYPVGSSIESIRSHRSHSFRKASCISSDASARFPVTKYSALNSPECSSAKNAAKSGGACSAAGNLMTSPSACIALLDAAEASSA